MHIKSIEIVGFKSYADVKIELDSHHNLIVGRNGSGKSNVRGPTLPSASQRRPHPMAHAPVRSARAAAAHRRRTATTASHKASGHPRSLLPRPSPAQFFDAIRFVFGDAMGDSIRADSRATLLHEGAGRAVQGHVEVVLDNTDGRLPLEGDEATLRRAVGLKKDGESGRRAATCRAVLRRAALLCAAPRCAAPRRAAPRLAAAATNPLNRPAPPASARTQSTS